jgi:hypothetical protein
VSRRRKPANRGTTDAAFWGRPAPTNGTTKEAPSKLRPTPDPAAVPASLGDPPLASANRGAAQRQLAVVYEEAVRAATALAAANGLLDDQALP